MKRINAPTIQEAIKKASDLLECSILEIDYEVITYPSNGFLGMFKREALIVACRKESETQQSKQPTQKPQENKIQTNKIQANKIQESTERVPKIQKVHKVEQCSKTDGYMEIESNFFKHSLAPQEIAQEIQEQLTQMFAFLPYEIEKIKVKVENQLVSVEFFGNDCGLLIGEKGYRYSAIYHLLSIWIKKDYGMSLKLEIADFLKNKEKKIEEYLEENYDKMTSRNFFQTKSFDSISIHIALKRFREAIPNKYIIAKTISETESVIVLNDFKSK